MSELDKTIEDLEAEVTAELEEKANVPTKGAVPAEKGSKVDGEVEDLGAPVVKGDEKKGPDAAKKAKKDSTVPSAGGETAPQKLKADAHMEGYSDEEIRELCHSKDHDCATVVEHPVWGKGKPVHGSHAIPTDSGYVEWYDVQFKHGVEEKVMAEDMKISVSEAHHKEEDKEPKTKVELKAAMDKMMAGMKKDQMMSMYAQMQKGLDADAHGGDDDAEEDEADKMEVKKEELDKRISTITVEEDVNALVEGEDLSEDFQKKAATIFEAAVKSKIRSEVERIELEKVQEVAEEVESFKDELTEKVDSYLDYVVKEWMQENELAIDRGLKGEIAEDFITGLKALFEEHYIDVPDEKYDILEGQAQKIEDLESKLNETIEKMTEMNKEKSTLVREQVIAKVSTDLAETEKEKFEGLVEDVEFTSEEDFTEKLNTLKESYFPKTVSTQTIEEEVDTENKEVDVSGAMAAYMSAIQKSQPYVGQDFNIVKNEK
tara:strand:+ start:138 stop:1601 length:1464 start_codon:yes stop_codon:yes gene_type:complete